jgi:hypothetical protein
VGSNKKSQREASPVVDITHQSEWKNKIHESERPHEERKLKKPGDKTNQKRYSHPEIQAPFDNLPVHDNHIRL